MRGSVESVTRPVTRQSRKQRGQTSGSVARTSGVVRTHATAQSAASPRAPAPFTGPIIRGRPADRFPHRMWHPRPMKRRLAPSFLVTTCALAAPGCHHTPDTTSPPPPSTVAMPTHNPPAPLPMKRKRTAPAPAFDTSAYVIAWGWSASQSLNPTDAEGHTIYTGGDDACYFETPAPPPTTPQPTGSRTRRLPPGGLPARDERSGVGHLRREPAALEEDRRMRVRPAGRQPAAAADEERVPGWQAVTRARQTCRTRSQSGRTPRLSSHVSM